MKLANITAGTLLLLAITAPVTANHHTNSHMNVVETAMASDQHETLVAAVQAADLGTTLSGDGPFTVFAPTDPAFNALPSGVVTDLLKPENRSQLQSVLTYHIVPGRYSAGDLLSMIEANGGNATLTTVEGGVLHASVRDGTVIIADENGRTASVVSADLAASNGIIHVTDAVSLPG